MRFTSSHHNVHCINSKMSRLLSSSLSLLLLVASATALSCGSLPIGYDLMPHADCGKYYRCYGTTPLEENCATGLYFNYNRQMCDIAIPSTCVTNSSPTVCYGVAHQFLPDLSDCSRYRECYQGVLYNLQCPSGLKYNSALQVCKDPTTFTCSTIVAPPPVASVCYTVSASNTDAQPYPGHCEYYYTCQGSTATLHKCPAGQNFNAYTRMCDYPPYAPCTANNSVTPTGPFTPTPVVPVTDPRCYGVSYDVLPDPTDCNKYIVCNGGSVYQSSCPTGMYFAKTTSGGECVGPIYGVCSGGVVITKPPPGNPGSLECGRTPDGLLPYPGDCTKYYQCEADTKIEMDCPPGLIWHQAILACDYPHLTYC